MRPAPKKLPQSKIEVGTGFTHGDAAYPETGYIPNRANAGRLKTKESILSQVSELQVQTEKWFHFSKQHVIDALIENAGKALGRRPVIGGGDAHYYVGQDPTFAIYTSVPFGLNTRMQNSWWYQGGGEQLGNEFFKKYGVIAHAGGNTGTQMGGWFRKEIKTTADLAGLKFRIAGIAGQILQKVGAVPQQLAGDDVYPALEKGTIDAAEWVGPYDDEKLGLQKVAKFYYYPGFWEAGPMLHIMTNLDKWNSLPKYYQAVIANAAAHANIWMSARYDLLNPAALKRLVATGTQLRPSSNEIMEACLKATNELWGEISAKNADFKKPFSGLSIQLATSRLSSFRLPPVGRAAV